MTTLLAQLDKIAADAFEASGFKASFGAVTLSDRPEISQFQCNGSFAAAKEYKRAPLAIAGEVADKLRENGVFAKAEAAAPGFINLTLSDEFLAGRLNELAADENLGVTKAEKPATIVIDYGGANIAKPLHIGHLRSAIIGECLKRIARLHGHRVIGDTHLGDWGMPMGLIIAELTERHPDWNCLTADYDGSAVPTLDVDILNEIYPFASAKSKENADFRAKAHTCTFELQNGRPGYMALWKEIMRVSIEDLKKIYGRLMVDFDYWYGESDADKDVPELMDILAAKGLLRESEGALVVDVAEESDKAPMPPLIARKSDGSAIYATTDLATIIQRRRDFTPDYIWYLTDNRQGLHFTQVFRAAKKAGLVPLETGLEFHGFGTINGSDGKPFKTRDGGVMRLNDLLEMVVDAAGEKLQASEYVKGDKTELAEKIALAAVKFGDLSNQKAKDYIFDIDKFLAFEGKTGAYLLYTVARINSILAKTGKADAGMINGIYSDSERELALRLAMAPEAFKRAMDERAPNYLCDCAYQIASAFSRFYHDNRIIDEPDEKKRASWLALIGLVRGLLVKLLEACGIETVENM